MLNTPNELCPALCPGLSGFARARQLEDEVQAELKLGFLLWFCSFYKQNQKMRINFVLHVRQSQMQDPPRRESQEFLSSIVLGTRVTGVSLLMISIN
jgi:hypothetical protein